VIGTPVPNESLTPETPKTSETPDAVPHTTLSKKKKKKKKKKTPETPYAVPETTLLKKKKKKKKKKNPYVQSSVASGLSFDKAPTAPATPATPVAPTSTDLPTDFGESVGSSTPRAFVVAEDDDAGQQSDTNDAVMVVLKATLVSKKKTHSRSLSFASGPFSRKSKWSRTKTKAVA
jgi:hypothetical protein